MTHFTTISRLLLGLVFTTFALNYFVPFLPPAEPPPPAAQEFLGVFTGSGFLTLVKAIELAAGLLLLAGLFVPLALTLWRRSWSASPPTTSSSRRTASAWPPSSSPSSLAWPGRIARALPRC